MEPSRRSLSVVVVVVVVVLLLMSTNVARVQAEQWCDYPSRTYKGVCFWSFSCAKACRNEASPQRPGHNYEGGVCRGSPWGKCFCKEPCSKASAATVPDEAHLGDATRAHD
ncbi:hypothetical protein EJB05_13733 [Eragrostis curvula]|uniref:Knottins-like domain-containing protein n=1 Tax=Eragrostis curvula TaxID=38414 RepID=A0A5J9VXD2_9POAL|nr:hypothetical protein EJB05_13733 [Eragrostis curvula]